MKKIYALLAFAAIAVSCGDSDESGSGGAPDAAVLIAPIDNSECLTGTPVSSTQSKITFEWNPSENATDYKLYVKNLVTNSSVQYNAGSALTYDVTLEKGTPYSWYVSARKESGAASSSDTWQFYNAGDSVTNYAPFPAQVILPAMSSVISGTQTTLEWEGSDVENNIRDYKIYFGTSANPTALLATVTQPQLPNVAVTPGQTYYWNVVTTDQTGNSSTSQVFQFKVQ